MQHQQPLPFEIISHIKGIENVHCVVDDPRKVRDFYAALFGEPAHTDGEWSEFKIAGFDFAVTAGDKRKFVITFKVERLAELHALLESRLSTRLTIQHGEYGDYVEVCPPDGYCLHFFEAKKRASSIGSGGD